MQVTQSSVSLNNVFYIRPTLEQKKEYVILVDSNADRRSDLGNILTNMGYHVLACRNLDTVVKYNSLYKKATFLVSPDQDPVEMISELYFCGLDWNLIPLQAPATK